jgi:hypothetical protein
MSWGSPYWWTEFVILRLYHSRIKFLWEEAVVEGMKTMVQGTGRQWRWYRYYGKQYPARDHPSPSISPVNPITQIL